MKVIKAIWEYIRGNGCKTASGIKCDANMQKVGGSLLCAELIAFFAPGFQAEDPQEH
jgi:hypothetical protein